MNRVTLFAAFALTGAIVLGLLGWLHPGNVLALVTVTGLCT